MKHLATFIADESGSGAIEYGLLAAMIACFTISALQKLGPNLTNKFTIIKNALS